MLYYDINYYHNRFFIINNKYYIFVYVVKNNHVYDFKLINNHLHFYITNKQLKIPENFKIKIMVDNKSAIVNINNQKGKSVNLGNINNFDYTDIHKEDAHINIQNKLLEEHFDKIYINFNNNYYIKNNKFINLDSVDNEKYIKYHWHYCGQHHPYMYFKYLLRKYSDIIFKKNFTKLSYDIDKKNTLLFVDDRYDPSFLYLLALFLYSVDDSWNITVFTKEENMKLYENDFDKLGISGKINKINGFKNMNDYSNLLKSYSFWERIPEENSLLFQYDSFCMGKFKDVFYNYNYIGARWPHNPFDNKKMNIGNGGTSFRKTRIMEKICKENSNNEVEDLFFSKILYDKGLMNCTEEIADMFSFENIFNEDSVYAHQIYNTIELSKMDTFVYNKLVKM
jgi:hypothetical protein